MMKRDTILPRPYGDVETMADAHKISIAWPYQRVIYTSSFPFFMFGESDHSFELFIFLTVEGYPGITIFPRYVSEFYFEQIVKSTHISFLAPNLSSTCS